MHWKHLFGAQEAKMKNRVKAPLKRCATVFKHEGKSTNQNA